MVVVVMVVVVIIFVFAIVVFVIIVLVVVVIAVVVDEWRERRCVCEVRLFVGIELSELGGLNLAI